MDMEKLSRKVNSFWYFKHIRFSAILALISAVLLAVSICIKQYDNGFWAGLLINISSGIITGVFFCFLTGLKNKQKKEVSLTQSYFKSIMELCESFNINVQKFKTQSRKGKMALIKQNTDIVEQIRHMLGISIYKDFGDPANKFQDSDEILELLSQLLEDCEGMFSCSNYTFDLICSRIMKEMNQVNFDECYNSMLKSNDTITKISQSAYEVLGTLDNVSERLEDSII